MIFTFRGNIELDEDSLEERRSIGMKDTAIIHEICNEIRGKNLAYLTEYGVLEFTECEIKTDKEKVELPF